MFYLFLFFLVGFFPLGLSALLCLSEYFLTSDAYVVVYGYKYVGTQKSLPTAPDPGPPPAGAWDLARGHALLCQAPALFKLILRTSDHQ